MSVRLTKSCPDQNSKVEKVARSLEKYGAPRRSRTSDRLVRSQVLYPAELWAHPREARFYGWAAELSSAD